MKRSILRFLSLLIFSCIFFNYLPLLAQAEKPEGKPITIGEEFELQSKVLNETRPYLIGLPNNYDPTEDKIYPVVYLLDGNGHFHHTTGTVKFLSRTGRIPEMIVVGIPNTTDRTRDLTPPITEADKNSFPTAGGADNMLTFLSDELIPHIEKNYKTAPYRMLIGHSFGGLFVTHTMVHRPELFNSFISISPSLWWDNQVLVDQATAFFKENKDYEATLYMTMGNEGGSMLGGAWKLSAAMEERAPAGLNWEFRLMDEETHSSIPHRSTYYGMEMIFQDWKDLSNDAALSLYNQGGLEAIAAHYASLEEKFGIKGMKAPEQLINQLGYALLGQKRLDEAINVFRQNIEDYPKAFNAYDSLGEAYKAMGEQDKAIESYKKSLALNPNNTNGIQMLKELGVEYKVAEVNVPMKVLKTYVGKYQVFPDLVITVSLEDGKLYGQPTGATKEELTAITETKFYLKIPNGNVQGEFNKDEKGKVQSLTVVANGQEMVGKKVE